jgi:hypothetical protein
MLTLQPAFDIAGYPYPGGGWINCQTAGWLRVQDDNPETAVKIVIAKSNRQLVGWEAGAGRGPVEQLLRHNCSLIR